VKATFEVKRHEEYGDLGLWFVGRSWAEPLGAMAAAHDLMEHGLRDSGTAEEEYQALGRMLYIRGEDYFAQRGSRASLGENIAADILQQIRYAQQANYFHVGAPAKLARRLSGDFEHIEGYIQEALREAQRQVAGEFGDCGYFEDECLSYVKTYGAAIAHHLRVGFRKARKQYAGLPQYALCYGFQELERELEKALKHADYEGQRITASVRRRFNQLEVNVEAVWEDYE
jgi:hypothetical protein